MSFFKSSHNMVVRHRVYVSFVWAALTIFSVVGVFLGRESASYMAIGLSVMWVLNRIVREAFDGWVVLKALKEVEGNAELQKND